MSETNKGWKQPIPVKIDGLNPFETTVFQKILLRCCNTPQNIKVSGDNTYVSLERGQCIFGRFEFAREFGFSEKESLRVYRIVKKLEKVNKLMNIQRTKNCSVVTVQNYDDWVSLEQTNEQTVNKQRTNSEQTVNTNKSDKSVKTEKSGKRGSEASEILEYFNSTLRKNFKSTSSWQKNFGHWRSTYSMDDIKSAIDNIPHWWGADNPTPDLIFRTRNKAGDCDYIGELLNTKPKEESAEDYFSRLESAIDEAFEEHLNQQKYAQ